MAHYSAHTVIHQAGPWNPITRQQHCNVCGELLVWGELLDANPIFELRISPYEEGTLILYTPTYRAMTLTDRLPTCTPSPAAQANATEANANADVVAEGVAPSAPTGAPMGFGEFEDRYHHEYYGYPSEVDLED